MKRNYIDIVRNELGTAKLAVLAAMFSASTGVIPPGVKKSRFRADNPKWMDTLDLIGTNGLFLTLDRDCVHYRVKAYALPLIDDPHAKELLDNMEKVFSLFKDEFPRSPDNTAFDVQQTASYLGMEQADVQELYCYMLDVDGWIYGVGSDFPFADGSSVTIGERVLKHETFISIIEQVYSWHHGNESDDYLVVKIWRFFFRRKTNWSMLGALIGLAGLVVYLLD